MLPDRPLDCLAPADAPALPLRAVRPAGLDAFLAASEASGFLRASGFAGAAGQLALLPGGDGIAGAVLGLGEDLSPFAFGGLALSLPEGTAWRLEPGNYDPGAAALGFCLGAYQQAAHRTPKRRPALLQPPGGVEAALREAAAIASGDPRPLCGVPVGIKDLLSATEGLPTTHGSSAFGDWYADHDSAHVRRLREAGAIVIGKTNTPELGLRPVTENARFGVTRNPHDPSLSPGGSSDGSAAAVASGMVPLADGSDFGGSIRAAALAMRGDWHDLGGGLTEGSDDSVSLQPLARIDDVAERA